MRETDRKVVRGGRRYFSTFMLKNKEAPGVGKRPSGLLFRKSKKFIMLTEKTTIIQNCRFYVRTFAVFVTCLYNMHKNKIIFSIINLRWPSEKTTFMSIS